VHDIEDLVKVGQLVKGLALYCYFGLLLISFEVYAKLCNVQVFCCLHFQGALIMLLVLCQMMHNWYFALIAISLIQSSGQQWTWISKEP